MGTFALLEATKIYLQRLHGRQKKLFRLLHVSTDEIYGSCSVRSHSTPNSPYRPNSPYSASKAAADHFVRAYHKTYRLPLLTTHCANNYGPRQHPEKLIPKIITRALLGLSLPLYGDGLHRRQWLYVEDHAEALITVLQRGKVGRCYHIAGEEKSNLEMMRELWLILGLMGGEKVGSRSLEESISFIEERAGHDRRYSLSSERIEKELGWKQRYSLREGLLKTVRWYLDHPSWWQELTPSLAQVQSDAIGP